MVVQNSATEQGPGECLGILQSPASWYDPILKLVIVGVMGLSIGLSGIHSGLTKSTQHPSSPAQV